MLRRVLIHSYVIAKKITLLGARMADNSIPYLYEKNCAWETFSASGSIGRRDILVLPRTTRSDKLHSTTQRCQFTLIYKPVGVSH